MKLHEALLAVETHALCKYQNSLYYAYGVSYVRRLFGQSVISMELHDRHVPSVIYVKPSDVSIVRWNAPDDTVKAALARYEAIFQPITEGMKNAKTEPEANETAPTDKPSA
jgi:hypothetical protein